MSHPLGFDMQAARAARRKRRSRGGSEHREELAAKTARIFYGMS